ncbi:max-binding protein MNT [Platysternon megacephalum]|uniref:Max-binding protein MNT n=1 Tax=Platysternon megacephalum TaxID=55544 RepID=A0A4D9EPP2_9SAUR|nr:max-binding protein MNT [Platysternon megacephalum]
MCTCTDTCRGTRPSMHTHTYREPQTQRHTILAKGFSMSPRRLPGLGAVVVSTAPGSMSLQHKEGVSDGSSEQSSCHQLQSIPHSSQHHQNAAGALKGHCTLVSPLPLPT